MRRYMKSDEAPSTVGHAGTAQSARPPIQARTASAWRAQHRFSLIQVFRMTPSWLASMVLHLTCMLLLASLVVPLGTHTQLDRLFISFASEQESELDQSPLAVTTPQAEEAPPDETQSDSSTPKPATEQDHDTPRQARPSSLMDIPWSALKEMFRAPNSAKSNEPQQRIVRIEPVGRVDDSLSGAAPWIDVPDEYDDIVNRFIEYDVGRLRGLQGRDASRRFRALGSRAIPALVRGLNKSARIHASCPVGVISRKLEQLVYQTDDEMLVGYVMGNLGKNVPQGAPHRQRILALQRTIEDSLGGRRERIMGRLAELGWSVDESTAERVASLSVRPVEELRLLVAGKDPLGQVAAAMVLIVRADEFSATERSQLGLTLAAVMAAGADSQNVELFQQTSRRLAGDALLPDLMSAEQWRAHWRHEIQVQLMVRLTTPRLIRQMDAGDEAVRAAGMQALLESNRTLTDASRHEIAQFVVNDLDSPSIRTAELSYRTLVSLARGVDGGGHSVEKWRNYWRTHYFERTIVPRSRSYLRQARFLEDGGKRTAAKAHYRKLIESFPDTPAAREAEQRLASLLD